MLDLVMVAVTVGFFAAAGAFVVGCGRIMRTGSGGEPDAPPPSLLPPASGDPVGPDHRATSVSGAGADGRR